jgi:anti-sigma regulatory factor (Ser/Thr protein kinase)
MLDWICNHLSEMEFNSTTLRKIELASEEALVNIIRHAYQERPEIIEIKLKLFPKSHVEISIQDSGPPFNPLKVKEPDLTSNLEERAMGGLGIHFIKKNMDEVRYHRLENANVLILIKKISNYSDTGIPAKSAEALDKKNDGNDVTM